VPERQRLLATRAVAVVLGAGAAGVLLGITFAGGALAGGVGPAGSSYATSEAGAKASYLLLASLGYRVERRAEPIGDLRKAELAFLLAPESRLDRVDLVGLGDWIEGGGTLVYGVAVFEPAAETLRHALGLPALATRPVAEQEAELIGEWAPARKLVLRVGVDVEDRRGRDRAVAELARQGRAVRALVVQRGQGRIYVLDGSVLSNRGLKGGDNALFLAALAARHAGQGTIVFDEFVHGYGDAVSLLSIAAWPLRLALVTGVLALLVYALAAGRRLGPASPEPAPPRRASIEQIDALAAFYAVRKNRAAALEALAAWAGAAPPGAPSRHDAGFVAQARALVQAAGRHSASGGGTAK
jgi:hypothetical protein